VRTGVIFRAIAQDEITARACGIYTTFYKFMAFAVSGFFAGVSGGLYAHFIKVVGPSTLDLLFSLQAILWTIFGGFGTIYGPVVGVYLLFPITEFFTFFEMGNDIRFIFLSLVLIFTLLFMPEGLAAWIRDRLEEQCPRCKVTNLATRRSCRACGSPLHLSKQDSIVA
jgi:branched-chain amino acid transport system permease protein